VCRSDARLSAVRPQVVTLLLNCSDFLLLNNGSDLLISSKFDFLVYLWIALRWAFSSIGYGIIISLEVTLSQEY